MAKFCVFCGNPPQDKNKEHVIPQWLINMTGKRSRIMNLETITDRDISFYSFTFPACEECNSEFAKLEASIKNIVEKLMAGQALDSQELNLLLDWFDKVRVGIWLAFLQLKGEIDDKNPHMHIKSRVGLKDRMLIVERLDDSQLGIGIIGANTDAFLEAPNAFQLRINNYIFTNVSDCGLVSRRLGFPFTDRYHMFDLKGGLGIQNMQHAKGRIVTPVINKFKSPEKSITIYQPMYRGEQMAFPDVYKSEYVKNHSLDVEKGIGGIFVQRGSGAATYLEPGRKITLTPKFSSESDELRAVKLFQLHNHVLTTTYTTASATPEHQKIMNALNEQRIRANNRRIEAFSKAGNITTMFMSKPNTGKSK